MFRIVANQFFKINLSTNCTVKSVRTICVNSCIQLNKATAQEIAERKHQDAENRWSKFYSFKDMKYHAIVTRLKIYPLVSTIFLTPLAYVFEIFNFIPEFSFVPSLAFGITATTTLAAYSKAIANTIGIVYICKENKNLKIAYIDFIGGQNFITTTVDQVREWEKSPVKFGLYKTIYADNGKEKIPLKMPWRNTNIYDMKSFRRIFGK